MSKDLLKGISILVCAIMVFSVSLFGCSKNSNTGKASETVKVEQSTKAESPKLSGTLRVALTSSVNYEDVTDPSTGEVRKGIINLFKQYTDNNPGVKLEGIEIPAQGSVEKLQSLLMSNSVDVLYASLAEQYAQGFVLNLKDLIEKKEPQLWDAYIPGMKETERVSYNEDNIIGLPGAGISAATVSYDKQIFQDWGVEPLSKDPTAKEVLEKAAKIHGKNPKTGKMNYGLWYHNSQVIYMIDLLNDGFQLGKFVRMDYKKSKVEVSTPENNQKIRVWLDSIKFTHPGVVSNQGNEKWGTEDNDIAIMPRSFISDFDKVKANELTDRFIATNGIKDPDGGVSYNAPMAWCIAKSVSNVDLAWEAIKFLAGYEGQKFMYESYKLLPSIKNADFMAKADQYDNAFMEAGKGKARYMFFPPYMLKTFRPYLQSIMALAADNKPIDLDKDLEKCQKEFEAWCNEQLPIIIK